MAVIREIVANCFAHASYNGNTYHEICIHPDKITIYSPGTYASSYQPEDYINQSFPSAIRNATISKILYLNKSIEQFGSGFKRINNLCKDAKLLALIGIGCTIFGVGQSVGENKKPASRIFWIVYAVICVVFDIVLIKKIVYSYRRNILTNER